MQNLLDPSFASSRGFIRLTSRLYYDKFKGKVYLLQEASQKIQDSIDTLQAYQKTDDGDVCCPLPLSLQDLCLMVVISDLDLYEVSRLASLPCSLRRRLLSVAPAIDLCRLERTDVASGVDVDAIWNSRREDTKTEADQSREKKSFSSMIVCSVKSLKEQHQDLVREFVLLRGSIEERIPIGKEFLTDMVSNILTAKSLKIEDLDKFANKLISIRGEVLLSNLLSGSMHQPCSNTQCSHNVWKKQAVGLLVNVKSIKQPLSLVRGRQISKVSHLELTPYRLLDILLLQDPLILLRSLAKECHLKPSNAIIHIDMISKSFLKDLCAERLVLDSGFSLPTDSVSCTAILNSLLENLIILLLKCDHYSYVGVMNGIIKGATVKGDESCLKHLLCIMPDIYLDAVETFVSLFLLKKFQKLTLEVRRAYPLMLIKLLQGFMSALSADMHKLVIHSKSGLVFPSSLPIEQLAAFGSANALPTSVAQHKILEFSSNEEFTKVLYLLLQLPSIRLKELKLLNIKEYYQYIHLCAVHPDLEMTKLVIDLGDQFTLKQPDTSSALPTIQEDFESLFKKHELQKVAISGIWGEYMEIKEGLLQGLQSRACLPPLKKLVLDLELADCYKMREFQLLCDAIFSLPQLDDLKLVLGKGFVDIIAQERYEKMLFKSWNQKASNIQLKSVCLNTLYGIFNTYEKLRRT